MRSAFGLVLVLLLVIPRPTEAASIEKPVISRCGRHVVEMARGLVRLDGKALRANGAAGVELLVGPAWRRDCSAVAWVELRGTARRLIVVPSIGDGAEALSWALPPTIGDERIFWVGRSRIAVGVVMLQPRAMASWS